MIKEALEKRKLPPLFEKETGDWLERRREIQEILSSEFCGYATRLKAETQGRVIRREENSYGGKAVTEYVELLVISDYSSGSFPFTITLPKGLEKAPVFLYLSFQPEIADGLGEEILDGGYGIVSVRYQDIAPDYFDDHKGGLGRFCTRNPYDSWGKLRIWAWGCSRIMDYLETAPGIDLDRVAVMGHSRLGKAALLAGGFDERFRLTVSNESGGGGAALFRGKTGEVIENLYGQASRLWFDGNFFRYRKKEAELPFDQHFLLALAAPRYLYVASASEDNWSDPASEFLGCAAASEAYERLGLPGLVCEDRMPETGETLHEGRIGYHLRKGTHYLSRWDWQQVIAYRERHHI